MADATATVTKWYHKGWPPFLLGLVLGALVLGAPIVIGYGWVKRKVSALTTKGA